MDGVNAAPNPSPSPRGPKSHGYELVIPDHAEDDGNFGLTDDEIMHPSRETIIGWLKDWTTMLASSWSKIAARMFAEEPIKLEIVAAE